MDITDALCITAIEMDDELSSSVFVDAITSLERLLCDNETSLLFADIDKNIELTSFELYEC